jgi:hypothetical protein
MLDSHRMLRRRDFLGQVGVVAVGSSFAETASASVAPRKSPDAMGHPLDLSHEQWATLIGNHFAVLSAKTEEHVPVDLILCDVRLSHALDDAQRPACCRDRPFSLLLESRDGSRIANATHLVSNSEVGKFPLFLHEITQSNHSGTVRYEAVFG